MIRSIQETYPGRISSDGAGVKLNRIFSRRDIKDIDPFLLLDFFDSKNPEDYTKGFPWHPHRGIETITYLIEGELEHGDSLGNSGVIKPYGCQWMTAGSGIIHQEMPQASQRMLGAQLWLNLPREHKMTKPEYRDITKDDLGIYSDATEEVRVICGNYKGVKGAVKGTYVDPIYLDVSINKEKHFQYEISESKTVYLLMIKGAINIQDKKIAFKDIKGVLLTKGDTIDIKGITDARFLLMAAEPLKEPVAWGGPIVMNTEKELNAAFKALEDGTFIQDNA
ncbi:MAG TPA: pirin family protein [Clostridia bacterium]|nr:pirin family protein [Clostridia bacterium]